MYEFYFPDGKSYFIHNPAEYHVGEKVFVENNQFVIEEIHNILAPYDDGGLRMMMKMVNRKVFLKSI